MTKLLEKLYKIAPAQRPKICSKTQLDHKILKKLKIGERDTSYFL